MITGKNYIGSNSSAKGEVTFNTFNPLENKPTEWTFTEATSDEINDALDLASEAFLSYKNVPALKRAQFLETIALEIEELGESLLTVYSQESGLPAGRAQGERGRTLGQLRAFAALLKEGAWVDATIDTAQPDRTPMPKVDLRKMLVPLGPVVVFGASNFPLAFSTAGGDTASALAAGCPVIVKGHPMHAGTSDMVAQAVLKAAKKCGMPEGVFSQMNSSGIEVGQQLVQHPKVKAVGFTGSIKGGTALYKLAANRDEPIPVFAEMGSINPVVALPSALKEKGVEWASAYAGSITAGTGQFCTKPGIIIGVDSPELNAFKEVLATELNKVAATCMLHPAILKGYKLNKELVSKEKGVAVLTENLDEVAANYANQMVVTSSGADFIANSILQTEVFGPFSLVVSCKDIKELTTVVNVLEGQLTGTILGSEKEINSSTELVASLGNKVGRIIFNGVPTGVEVCPSMQHGGPFPASSDSRFSAVGTSAIKRWARPFAYQNWPKKLLPIELQDANPLKITRIINGIHSADAIK